jgi:[protein-PII] uridylyltransferase
MGTATASPEVPLRETCRDYLSKHRSVLQGMVQGGQHGLGVAEGFARMYDGLLGSLCCAAAAAAREQQGQSPLGRLALVAVGGYGRRLMAPHSDVDVLFLCDEPSDPRIASLAESVLYPLWDVGVDIGHAVRGLEETLELAETDIRTSTTLLDMRHVAGDKTIVQELSERGRKLIFEDQLERFVAALETDTEARHERFGDSLYVREPELKLGRGGLRDLDVILWCLRARWGIDSLAQVPDRAALSALEVQDLRVAQENLWTVRNRMHVLAGRRHDRVTYEDQQSLAAALGFRDDSITAVEQYLQAHFRHGRAIARVVDFMGDRVRRSLRPPRTSIRDLGGGVLVHERRLTFKRMDLHEDPSAALRLYAAVARESFPPDPEARDLIAAFAANREWSRRLRRQDEASATFSQLLVRNEGLSVKRGSPLQELHDVGLLLAMIPELEPVTGRVRHDAYHAYTVDAHAIMAIDRLRALVRGELAAEYPNVSRAAAEMSRPLPLYLAILLHGIGAGHPDDPAKHAAAVAGAVGERLGLAATDVQHMQWLIANQHTMYFWATRRDIADPGLIAEVAREVRTAHGLRDLYLFTFCRVSTIGPSAMSAWNARMLDELWRAVAAHLDGRDLDVTEQLDRIRHELVTGIAEPVERARMAEFAARAGERYLLSNSLEAIRYHSQVVTGRKNGLAFGATDAGTAPGTLELVIGCDDRPGLLADLTAALAAARFSVDSAQVYTRKMPQGGDEAFDIFHVTHPNVGADHLMAPALDRLRENILALLDGRERAHQLLAKRSRPPAWTRPGPRIKTEINVDNAASPRFTVVDVYTRDRPDLLHLISRTLHEKGLSIALAKVNTEGQRVADVFYVRTPAGGKLDRAGQLAELSIALREAIRKLDSAV